MLGNYHLTVLYDLLKNLHFLYESDKIYIYLLENLVKAVDADAASLFILDPEGKSLILRTCTGPKKNVLEFVSQEMNFPVGKGICGWVAKFNQPIIVDDAQKDERFSSQVDIMTGYKTKSVLCAPISNKDQVLGVIEILNKKSAVFNKNDLDLLSLIARQAAIALENARLYKQVEREHIFNESVLSNLTGGFIAIDANQIITFVNPVAEKILLISAGEAVGKKCSEVLKYYPAIHKEITETVSSKEKKVRQEINCDKLDKTPVKIGYSTFPIKDKSQNVLGAGMIFQDLTQYAPTQ